MEIQVIRGKQQSCLVRACEATGITEGKGGCRACSLFVLILHRQPWLTLLFNISLQRSERLESHWRTYCGIPLPRNVAVEFFFFFFLVKQDFSGIKNTSMNFSKLDHARIFSSGNSFPPPSQTDVFFFLFKTS